MFLEEEYIYLLNNLFIKLSCGIKISFKLYYIVQFFF